VSPSEPDSAARYGSTRSAHAREQERGDQLRRLPSLFDLFPGSSSTVFDPLMADLGYDPGDR
jgi:hypothetical protein